MPKKRKFDLAGQLEELLRQPLTDPEEQLRGAALGLPPEKLCKGSLLLIALYESARSGNMPALKELLSLLERSSGKGEGVRIVDDL